MLNGTTIWTPPPPVYSGAWSAMGVFAGAYNSETGSAHGYAITPIVTSFTYINPSAVGVTAHGDVKYWRQGSGNSWSAKTSAADYFDPTRIHSSLYFQCKIRSRYSGRGFTGSELHFCIFPFQSAIWTGASALSGQYYVSSYSAGARTLDGVPDGSYERAWASGSAANAGWGAYWRVTATAASARFVHADSSAKCIIDAASGLDTYKWATYYPNTSAVWTASGVLLP